MGNCKGLLGWALVLTSLGQACGDGDDDDTVPPDAGGEGEGEGEGEDGGPDAGPGGTIDWAPCGDFECATLAVPIDHAAPEGPTLPLALLRARALTPEARIGVLLLNPGGPGGAVVAAAPAIFRNIGQLAPDFAARFDLVAFDPRGVGQSAPIDCVDDADLESLWDGDLTPDDDLEWAAVLQATQDFADGCASRSADRVGWVYTENVARDMDLLREGLGEQQLNYLGVSYGTVLGATYASLFPDRVRAFVLDSPVAPRADMVEYQSVSVAAYEVELERFFEECGADPGCSFHGGEGAATLGAAYDALALALDTEGLPTTSGRVLSQSLFYAAVTGLLRGGLWDDLAIGLADAAAGDGSALLPAADAFTGHRDDGTWTNFLEALVAILLGDVPCPADYDEAALRADSAAYAATGPRIGSFSGGLLAYCVAWSVERATPRTPIDASAAPPMLVLAGLHDPATPYGNVEPFLAALGNDSHLLTWEGNGHGIANRNLCTLATTLGFFLDPTAPIEAETCGAN